LASERQGLIGDPDGESYPWTGRAIAVVKAATLTSQGSGALAAAAGSRAGTHVAGVLQIVTNDAERVPAALELLRLLEHLAIRLGGAREHDRESANQKYPDGDADQQFDEREAAHARGSKHRIVVVAPHSGPQLRERDGRPDDASAQRSA
jgi:hypothetical protein